eukprot:m.442911 g.442911  ORF g.442911 m.442911 type:complete len:113 (-) comp18876_c0_seq1:1563-1901(-)
MSLQEIQPGHAMGRSQHQKRNNVLLNASLNASRSQDQSLSHSSMSSTLFFVLGAGTTTSTTPDPNRSGVDGDASSIDESKTEARAASALFCVNEDPNRFPDRRWPNEQSESS